VPVSEDILKSINPTAGDTRGNVGLLKDGGNLQWPQALTGEAFKEAREGLSKHMKQAVQTITAGNKSADESTLADMQADLKRLNETADASVNLISPDQSIEAKRYLGQVGIRGQGQQVHDLTDARPRYMAQRRQLAVCADWPRTHQLIQTQRQRHQPSHPRHATGRQRHDLGAGLQLSAASSTQTRKRHWYLQGHRRAHALCPSRLRASIWPASVFSPNGWKVIDALLCRPS
jgi:hypothetical protein